MTAGGGDERPRPASSSRLLARFALPHDAGHECVAHAPSVTETSVPSPNCRVANRNDLRRRRGQVGNSPSPVPSVDGSYPRPPTVCLPRSQTTASVSSNGSSLGPATHPLHESLRHTRP